MRKIITSKNPPKNPLPRKAEKKTPGNVRAIGPSRAASSKEVLVIHCLEKFAADVGNLEDFWLYWGLFYYWLYNMTKENSTLW